MKLLTTGPEKPTHIKFFYKADDGTEVVQVFLTKIDAQISQDETSKFAVPDVSDDSEDSNIVYYRIAEHELTLTLQNVVKMTV